MVAVDLRRDLLFSGFTSLSPISMRNEKIRWSPYCQSIARPDVAGPCSPLQRLVVVALAATVPSGRTPGDRPASSRASIVRGPAIRPDHQVPRCVERDRNADLLAPVDDAALDEVADRARLRRRERSGTAVVIVGRRGAGSAAATPLVAVVAVQVRADPDPGRCPFGWRFLRQRWRCPPLTVYCSPSGLTMKTIQTRRVSTTRVTRCRRSWSCRSCSASRSRSDQVISPPRPRSRDAAPSKSTSGLRSVPARGSTSPRRPRASRPW